MHGVRVGQDIVQSWTIVNTVMNLVKSSLAIISSKLMMRKETTLETSDFYIHLTRLITREDFIEFCRRETYRSYNGNGSSTFLKCRELLTPVGAAVIWAFLFLCHIIRKSSLSGHKYYVLAAGC